MNSAHPHDDRRPESGADVSATMKDRCFEYLLGELSNEQANDFEQQLANDSELNRELLVQSELLFALTCSETKPLPAPTASKSGRTHWGSWIAALAACILFVITGSQLLREQPAENSGDDEGLLIAQAWAEAQSTESDDLNIAMTGSELIGEADELFEETGDDDSIPSWMVVAFAADEDNGELGDG